MAPRGGIEPVSFTWLAEILPPLHCKDTNLSVVPDNILTLWEENWYIWLKRITLTYMRYPDGGAPPFVQQQNLMRCQWTPGIHLVTYLRGCGPVQESRQTEPTVGCHIRPLICSQRSLNSSNLVCNWQHLVKVNSSWLCELDWWWIFIMVCSRWAPGGEVTLL